MAGLSAYFEECGSYWTSYCPAFNLGQCQGCYWERRDQTWWARRSPSLVFISFSFNSKVKDIYFDLVSKKNMSVRQIFPMVFWKQWCPLKMITFSWLVFYNKNLTWENLRKRWWHGPSRCVICEADEEKNFHMFLKCEAPQQIWYDLAISFHFPHLCFISTRAYFMWWGRQEESKRIILPIALWSVWNWRNLKIFDDSKLPFKSVLMNIFALYESIPRRLQCSWAHAGFGLIYAVWFLCMPYFVFLDIKLPCSMDLCISLCLMCQFGWLNVFWWGSLTISVKF